MIRNRAHSHWLKAHGRFGCQWLQCGVKNMLIVICKSFPIGLFTNPLFCSLRNLITTIANELKAYTKYNHARTMNSACVCSNISGFCSFRDVEGGSARRDVIFFSTDWKYKVPKIFSSFVSYFDVDSFISRGLTIESTFERGGRCVISARHAVWNFTTSVTCLCYHRLSLRLVLGDRQYLFAANELKAV